jgi:hypothetical protein
MLKWFKKLPVRKKGDPLDQRIPTKEGMDLGIFIDRHETPFTELLRETYSDIEG